MGKKAVVKRETDFELDISVPELEEIRKELVQINRNLERLNHILMEK
jgi:hypothetical protein